MLFVTGTVGIFHYYLPLQGLDSYIGSLTLTDDILNNAQETPGLLITYLRKLVVPFQVSIGYSDTRANQQTVEDDLTQAGRGLAI